MFTVTEFYKRTGYPLSRCITIIAIALSPVDAIVDLRDILTRAAVNLSSKSAAGIDSVEFSPSVRFPPSKSPQGEWNISDDKPEDRDANGILYR